MGERPTMRRGGAVTANSRVRGGGAATGGPAPRRRLRRGSTLRGAALAVVLAAAVITVAGPRAAAAGAPQVVPLGTAAPNDSYTTVAGGKASLGALHGQPTLLWLVTTWCQHCQAGTQALAANINTLASYGVHVVELEMANDMGKSGPSIASFGRQYAGTAYRSRDWTWGEASKRLTQTYDPGGYTNIYYLIAGNGRVTYVNASPDASMSSLMVAAVDLSRGITGPMGPEDVPDPSAPSLAGLGKAATGKTVDGISCNTSEQLLFHVHTHLTIFVAGKQRSIPAGIGIAPPRGAQKTPYGPFVDSGSCFYWLHTHAKDGIIHIESPVKRTYTLGEFFDIWGQPLGPDRVGPAKGKVTAFVDGQPYHGDPRAIQLGSDVQVQLDVGTPVVKARLIRFPKGL